MKSAVFVDRDGVINEDRGYAYVRSWEEFEFIPGVKETLVRLKERGIPVVVVTNQSCINKGLVAASRVDCIHRRMREEIEAAGGEIAGIYCCPHRDEDRCVCRKPQAGLLLEAAGELELNLEQSVMVGDSVRDLETGRRAGTRTVLVLTGKGKEELLRARERNLEPDFVCENLEGILEFLEGDSTPVIQQNHEGSGE